MTHEEMIYLRAQRLLRQGCFDNYRQCCEVYKILEYWRKQMGETYFWEFFEELCSQCGVGAPPPSVTPPVIGTPVIGPPQPPPPFTPPPGETPPPPIPLSRFICAPPTVDPRANRPVPASSTSTAPSAATRVVAARRSV